MIENETMNEDITNEDVDLEIEEAEASQDETEDETEAEHTQTESSEEMIERLTKENKTLKIQKAKKAQKAQPTALAGNMSANDMFALMNAKVTDQESIDEVTAYAKFKNINVSEALKSSVVKTILEEKRNEQKVASATNTGSARRGNSEVSEDVLLANASKGKMPDNDADLQRFIEARMTRRK